MITLSQTKTLGGIGALLLVLSGVPGIGILAALAGYILILFAIKNISKILEDKSIFNNMLIASITGITWVIAVAISFLILLMRLETDVNMRDMGVLLSVMLPVVIGLLLFWILFIISAIYEEKL